MNIMDKYSIIKINDSKMIYCNSIVILCIFFEIETLILNNNKFYFKDNLIQLRTKLTPIFLTSPNICSSYLIINIYNNQKNKLMD